MSTSPNPAAPHRIRLLIADDHMVMRMGIVTAASRQPDMVVVADVESGEEALAAYREHQPDVVIMDLRMGDLSGLETIRLLRAEFPTAKIVVFSNYARSEEVYKALKTGAAGFVVKNMKATKLLDAIRAVDRGERFLPDDLAPKARDRLPSQLSDRELEVLRLLADGRSNKEIGQTLGVTEGTIKVHVTNLFEKLGVTARTEAIVVAVRRGLVDIV
jgi:DNA-binding NarL/FixJ family response regulator